MSSAPFQVVPLGVAHDRTAFNSDSEPLNRYLREQATQDVRRRVAACYVALSDGQRIAGYYTLASTSLLLADLPANVGKKLPRYPTVPAVLMGRLVVDHAFKGQGLGGTLLADALDRAIRSEIAAYAMMVDAKDKAAAAFYRHHGFIALPDSPLTLFLPLATVRSFQNRLLPEETTRTPPPHSAKNDRLIAVGQHTAFQVIAQAACEHGFFDVLAVAHHVIDGIRVVDADHVLFDYRTLVEVGGHVVAGRADELHALDPSLMVRACTHETGQKTMVNVDDLPRIGRA